MLKRTFTAEKLNQVLNHPDVFPWVAMLGMERLDLSDIAEDPQNVVLMNEHGGFIFVPRGDGYEVHSQFLPEGRGESLKAAKEAADYIFSKTDAQEITTFVPQGNDGATRLVLAMRFEHRGREGTWTYPNGQTVPVDSYVLTRERFVCQPQH